MAARVRAVVFDFGGVLISKWWCLTPARVSDTGR
jgi:hypothetical protein